MFMTQTLVDRELKKAISKGIISGPKSLDDYVQPASIDIPAGAKAYHINHKFLPFRTRISDIIDSEAIQEVDLSKGRILYKGQTYLIPSLHFEMPETMSGRISPKSTIGRADLMVRSIADNIGLYDTLMPGTNGELWLEVTPQSFNVRLEEGIALSQIRLFDDAPHLNSSNFPFLYDSSGNPINATRLEHNKVVVTLSIPKGELMGYEAIETNEVVDLSKRDNPKESFWKELTPSKDQYILEKGKFYILYTKEGISVPPENSLEMIPFSHLIGELRVHYAGFFDPGFGYPNPASGVLEVRPHETIRVFDGQPICMMEIFENTGNPELVYGNAGNNYQNQSGPKLSKNFS